jgi:tetratricopeptide (TPR) repeat protein
MSGPRAKKRRRQTTSEPADRAPPLRYSISTLWWIAVIFCATLIAYWPAMNGGLLWDDAAHITRPGLRSLDGLRRIWFDLGATQQYYPLTHSAFWIQHKLWGNWLVGYHLVNVLLHSFNSVLLALILRRLNMPGAKLAGIIFALHPVHVESVAWITELKNTLSGLLYFAAVLCYLRFHRAGARRWYAAALLLFNAALLSKSVTATLPAALLVLIWWQRGRLEWRRDVLPLLPWLVLGIVSGLFTAWVERHYVGADSAAIDLSPLQRILIAGRAVWFYLGKLVWPVNLTFIYPRWELETRSWQWAPIAVVVAFGAFALSRQRLGRAPLAVALLFVGTLFPALGFVDVYPFIYTFVADHFQYLASAAPIAAAAALISHFVPRMRGAVYGIAVLGLGILSFRQSHIYKDAETLYRTTMERNRECWMAYNNLGTVLADDGRVDQAIRTYRDGLLVAPAGLPRASIHSNLGKALVLVGRPDEAAENFQAALKLAPHFADAHHHIGDLLSTGGKLDAAIAHYRRALELQPRSAETHNAIAGALAATGRPRDAIAHFNRALELRPDYPLACNNLAWLYVTCPDPQLRNGPEAVRLAKRAVELTGEKDPSMLDTLAAAHAETGKLPEAIATAEKALEQAKAGNDEALANQIDGRLKSYRDQVQNMPQRR